MNWLQALQHQHIPYACTSDVVGGINYFAEGFAFVRAYITHQHAHRGDEAVILIIEGDLDLPMEVEYDGRQSPRWSAIRTTLDRELAKVMSRVPPEGQ